MASLRSRLIAALLALATLGLLLLAGITYVEQRSFLMARVDEQVRDSPPAILRALSEQGIGGRVGDGDHGGGDGGARAPHGPGGPGGPGTGLPAGTFRQLRGAPRGGVGRV